MHTTLFSFVVILLPLVVIFLFILVLLLNITCKRLYITILPVLTKFYHFWPANDFLALSLHVILLNFLMEWPICLHQKLYKPAGFVKYCHINSYLRFLYSGLWVFMPLMSLVISSNNLLLSTRQNCNNNSKSKEILLRWQQQ